jgi:hypothetical protein
MPGFVTEQLAATGITGLEVKEDEDGKPLKPRWKGMTLKSERVEGRGQLIFQVHVFGNVAKPIGGISKSDGTEVFWKIAGENEPRKVSVNVNLPKERKKVPKTRPPKLKNR